MALAEIAAALREKAEKHRVLAKKYERAASILDTKTSNSEIRKLSDTELDQRIEIYNQIVRFTKKELQSRRRSSAMIAAWKRRKARE